MMLEMNFMMSNNNRIKLLDTDFDGLFEYSSEDSFGDVMELRNVNEFGRNRFLDVVCYEYPSLPFMTSFYFYRKIMMAV